MVLPMFHAATAPLSHFSPLHWGDLIFTMRRFDLESYLTMVQKHQITEGAFVPPMVHMIISSPLMRTEKFKNSLKSIRVGHTGAAPLDPGSQARLIPFLHPETTLTQVWGMTGSLQAKCNHGAHDVLISSRDQLYMLHDHVECPGGLRSR